MSTIKVDNIRIASESVSRPVTGVAAAFCSVENNSILETGSLNTTSYTNTGTGSGYVTITAAFSKVSNKIGVSGLVNSSSSAGCTIRGTGGGSTTSIYSLVTYDSTPSPVDLNQMSLIFHGDLA
jgi:hypothetical protein